MPSRSRQDLLLNFSVLFLTLVLLAGLVELGCRVYLRDFADRAALTRFATWQQAAGNRRAATPNRYWTMPRLYTGYGLVPGYRFAQGELLDLHNALGYRGEEIPSPKPAGEYRIVCIGGSTTYGITVADYRQSYPDQLERQLHQRGYAQANVINAGVSSYASWENLVDFEFRLLELNPDMVLLLIGVNDINARLVWPPEAYAPDNTGSRGPITPGRVAPHWTEMSTALRMLLILLGLAESPSSYERTIDSPAPTFYRMAFGRQVAANIYPSGIFKRASVQQMLDANPPTYLWRNLERIAVLARARNIAVVVLTFPYTSLFQEPPRQIFSTPEYQQALRECNALLGQFAADTQLPLCDLKPVIPDERPYWFPDGLHLSHLGSTKMSEHIAGFLAERQLVPARP